MPYIHGGSIPEFVAHSIAYVYLESGPYHFTRHPYKLQLHDGYPTDWLDVTQDPSSLQNPVRLFLSCDSLAPGSSVNTVKHCL